MIHANASRHSALSYGHAEAMEVHLRAEVQKLLALAALVLITNPPKAGRPIWVFVRKPMFCKGAATPGLNKVGGIMIEAGVGRAN